MERYEKEKLFQRTNCILEAFIILSVLLTGKGVTLAHTCTSFHLYIKTEKRLLVTPSSEQISNTAFLVPGKGSRYKDW